MHHYNVIYQLLLVFVVRALFVLGIVAALVGAGLIFRSAGMPRLSAVMNRWVYLSDSLKFMEVPYDIGPMVRRYRTWFGVFLILGGAFSIYGLVAQYEHAAIVGFLHSKIPPVIVDWIASSIRWILVLGCAVGVAIGAMLVFAPDKYAVLASRLDRAYSLRPIVDRADAMHLAPDRWVQTRPLLAGTIILVGSLIVVVSFGILGFRYH